MPAADDSPLLSAAWSLSDWSSCSGVVSSPLLSAEQLPAYYAQMHCKSRCINAIHRWHLEGSFHIGLSLKPARRRVEFLKHLYG
jgi:hypothetical protein